jgi:hypothetical protein
VQLPSAGTAKTTTPTTKKKKKKNPKPDVTKSIAAAAKATPKQAPQEPFDLDQELAKQKHGRCHFEDCREST